LSRGSGVGFVRLGLWVVRSIVSRLGIHVVDLGGEPQPTLSKVKMCELAFWVGHGVGCPETFVCSRAELVASHVDVLQQK
jgi:hypothetical protein